MSHFMLQGLKGEAAELHRQWLCHMEVGGALNTPLCELHPPQDPQIYTHV